jgi:hypothetical protein
VKVANPLPIRPVPMIATFTVSPVSPRQVEHYLSQGLRGSPCGYLFAQLLAYPGYGQNLWSPA